MIVDPFVVAAVAAIRQRDWPQVKAMLHPYLHWICVDGRTVRGRNNVLAHLTAAPAVEAPSRYEIRDGQIYRWIE
jgi:hypothetical protein